jgi:hypothetical protein
MSQQLDLSRTFGSARKDWPSGRYFCPAKAASYYFSGEQRFVAKVKSLLKLVYNYRAESDQTW